MMERRPQLPGERDDGTEGEKVFVNRAFEFDGEKYRLASGHQQEWGLQMLSELRLTGSEHILDLGCGDGRLTERLSRLVPEGSVLGIDASAGMIFSARVYARSNLEFRQMDIRDLDFQGQFDVIYSNAALHWVTDHRHLLRQSRLALRDGGYLLWNFDGAGNCRFFLETVRSLMQEEPYRALFDGFVWPWFMPSQSEYEQLLEAAGFSGAVVTLENRDRYFQHEEEMIRWMDQPCLVPFLTWLPDGARTAFRQAVIDRMLRVTRQPDGTCFETFRRIHVRAVK